MRTESRGYLNFIIKLCTRILALALVLSTAVPSDVYASYVKNFEDITFSEWDRVTGVNISADYVYTNSRTDGLNDLANFHYLSNINVSPKNESLTSYQGVLYDKKKTTLICFPQAKKVAEIPSTCKALTPGSLYGTSRSVRNQVRRIITRNNGGKWPGYTMYVNPINRGTYVVDEEDENEDTKK